MSYFKTQYIVCQYVFILFLSGKSAETDFVYYNTGETEIVNLIIVMYYYKDNFNLKQHI